MNFEGQRGPRLHPGAAGELRRLPGSRALQPEFGPQSPDMIVTARDVFACRIGYCKIKSSTLQDCSVSHYRFWCLGAQSWTAIKDSEGLSRRVCGSPAHPLRPGIWRSVVWSVQWCGPIALYRRSGHLAIGLSRCERDTITPRQQPVVHTGATPSHTICSGEGRGCHINCLPAYPPSLAQMSFARRGCKSTPPSCVCAFEWSPLRHR